MFRRILAVLSVILVLAVSISGIAYGAWAYKFPTTIQDTTLTNRTYTPVILGSNGQAFVDAGYMTSTGLATNMQDGNQNRKYMLATEKILTVVNNLPANSQVIHDLFTGYTPNQTSFPIITGTGGYFTANDANALELGNNFEIEQKGYVDVTAGTGKKLVNKPNAVGVEVDLNTTDKINGYIGSSATQPSQVIMGGSADPLNGAATEYFSLMGAGVWNGTEASVYGVIPTGGTLSELYVRYSANVPGGTTQILTVMKNGTPTSLVVTVSAGVSTGSLSNTSVSFVAGDLISVRSTYTGAPGAFGWATWTVIWTPTIPNESIFLANGLASNAGTFYFTPQGQDVSASSEIYAYAPMPTAGTFKKLYVQLSTDPGTAPDDYKFVLRKNVGDTTLTTTVVADNTTGNDTVNTVAVVAGDLVAYSVAPENVPTANPTVGFGMVFTPTTVGEYVVLGGSSGQVPSAGVTNYTTMHGNNPWAWNAVESTVHQTLYKVRLSKLYVKTRVAPDNGAGAQSYTFTLRENAGTTGITVAISEAATTGNDVVNTYTTTTGLLGSMQSVPANTPTSTTVHWGFVAKTNLASVSVLGLSSGEKTVTTRANLNNPQWATGNVLNFDGTATTSLINAGAIYNSQAKWWVSLWFKLDSTFSGGSERYILVKYLNASNYVLIYLHTVLGTLDFYIRISGEDSYLRTSQTSWTGGVWYNVIASVSDTAGKRLRINNGTALTDANLVGMPAGGNMLIGGRVSYVGIVGQIQNVVMGTDNLTPAEETALYNGTAPGDETDYWYIDEGTGNTIYSYGSAANNGTKGAAAAWQTSTYTAGQTGRLADFTLQVDSTRVGGNLESLGVSSGVPDNANDWYFEQYNVSAYVNSVTIDVSGAEVARYEPVAMIRGQKYSTGTVTVTNGDATVEGAGGATWTNLVAGSIFVSADGEYYVVDSVTDTDTLELTAVYAGGTLAGQTYNLYPRIPDETGTYDGAITWGANVGITLIAGTPSSYQPTASTAQTTGGFAMPAVPAPSNWWAAGADVASLPFYDAFNNVATQSGIPIQTLYLLPIWGLAFAMLFLVTGGTRSLFMGIIAMAIVLFIGSEMTVIPKWQPFMVLVLDFGVIFIQRQMGY